MKKIGLTGQEVASSHEKYGSNKLSEQETESFNSKFIKSFKDPIIKILCLALGINIIFVFLNQTEWYEAVGIAIAILLATFISTFSEYKNESSFKKLQDEVSKIKCKVYRDNELIEIPIDDIVHGDCIVLQTGDKVPADGVIIEGSIKVDQSLLNGESREELKIAKDTLDENIEISNDLLDEQSVFRGTVVVSGNAIFLVTTVGDQSFYGQIAKELQVIEDRDSPLKVKLVNLAKIISNFGYIGSLLIAISFLFKRIVVNNNFNLQEIVVYTSDFMVVGKDVIDAIILAVIIIVVAVPEGLPLMIAIVSALNMYKMLKDNVLVRKITGIETAGSLNILFSDKTGTITKGELEVVTFVSGDMKEASSFNDLNEEVQKILYISTFYNSDAVVSEKDEKLTIIGGNATEKAVLGFLNFDKFKHINVTKAKTVPFSSEKKYSATQIIGDYNLTLLKGAPENIIKRCKYFYDYNGNKQEFIEKSDIENKINTLAEKAIRVIAVATSEEDLPNDDLPNEGLTFIGILGIRDEIRDEAKIALEDVSKAGVQVVMITGDRKDTAVAISKEIGLIKNESSDLVLLSEELAKMSDDEIKSRIKDIRVIARALPTDKSRLVRLCQEIDLVAGMTGDGVNDSPALKKADVGFAMGSGTEVAKEASDIVIMDNNFKSIVKAVLYGRTIYHSLRKYIVYQLTVNFSAVLISFIAPFIGLQTPLTIIQILWVNLVMDTLASLAFGGEPPLKKYMEEKPKNRDENIVSKYMLCSILVGSISIFTISMFILLSDFAASIFRMDLENKYLLTGYFTYFIFTIAFNAFNARTESINLFGNIKQNRWFIVIIASIFMTQLVMTYFGGAIFNGHGLVLKEMIFVLFLSILIIPIDLIRKLIVNRLKI